MGSPQFLRVGVGFFMQYAEKRGLVFVAGVSRRGPRLGDTATLSVLLPARTRLPAKGPARLGIYKKGRRIWWVLSVGDKDHDEVLRALEPDASLFAWECWWGPPLAYNFNRSTRTKKRLSAYVGRPFLTEAWAQNPTLIEALQLSLWPRTAPCVVRIFSKSHTQIWIPIQ